MMRTLQFVFPSCSFVVSDCAAPAAPRAEEPPQLKSHHAAPRRPATSALFFHRRARKKSAVARLFVCSFVLFIYKWVLSACR